MVALSSIPKGLELRSIKHVLIHENTDHDC